MNFKQTQDAGLFLALARPLLEQEEAANNLTIGLTLALKDKYGAEPIPPEKAMMVLIEEEGVPIGCLMQTPPRNTIVYLAKGWREEAVAPIVEYFRSTDWKVPGIMAPTGLAQALVNAMSSPEKYKYRYRQRAWELREVIPPRPAEGTMRRARESDREVLEKYILGFQRDALDGEEGLLDPGRLFDFWTSKEALYVWEAEEVACMAVSNRQTWNGASVGYVYTPPELRGRGYGSNLVAGLSQTVLDCGKSMVSLFTDKNNPTSNKIYEQIGYRSVMELDTIVFT